MNILVNTRNVEEEKAVLAFLDSLAVEYKTDFEEDWGDLPDKVISDVKESMKQIENGQGIEHNTVKEMYKKWL
jgi:hypothetical protein